MKTIGKYDVIEEIGTGSMGTIYRARDTILDRDVALKVLRTGPDLDPELKERFYREARACAKLQHSNIVTVYDLGEADGVVHIVMELLTGTDMRRQIQEARGMPLLQKLSCMVQVCDALAHAHQQKLVHRDVKPSNIFLCHDQRAKVLDFGIARMPTSKLTIVGKVLGTPNYMAPEQILGRPCDSRSDLFSAAIVFAEFLVNAHPFQSTFIPRRIAEALPDSLMARDPQIPSALEKLLMRALEKDPERRLQTADEFAASIREIAELTRTGRSSITAPKGALKQEIVPPPQATPVAANEAVNPSAGEDLAEWRVSEFIRLLRDFDESLDLRNPTTARVALDGMKKLESADERFTAAIGDCDMRLSEMLASMGVKAPPAAPVVKVEPPPAPAPPPAAQPVAPPAPVQAAPPPPPPPPSIQASSPQLTATDVPPLVIERPAERPPDAPKPAPAETANTTEPPAKPAPAGKPKIPVKPLAAIAAGLVVVAVAAGWMVTRAGSAHAIEPALATGIVRSDSAFLAARPDADASKLVALARGQQVNVLKLPQGGEDDWLRVQIVAGAKVSPPGYTKAADLDQWASENPEVLLVLLKTYGPGETAPASEFTAEIGKLNALVAQFGSSPQAAEARIEIALAHFHLARMDRNGGKPVEEWQAHLDRAKAALDQVTGNPALEAEAQRLRAQWDALAPPEPEKSAQQTEVRPEVILRRVSSLWEQGNYRGAMGLVHQVLAAQPDHAEAKRWRTRIAEAQAFESQLK